MGASGRSDPEEWRRRLLERRRSSGMCGSAGDPVAERRRVAGETPCCMVAQGMSVGLRVRIRVWHRPLGASRHHWTAACVRKQMTHSVAMWWQRKHQAPLQSVAWRWQSPSPKPRWPWCCQPPHAQPAAQTQCISVVTNVMPVCQWLDEVRRNTQQWFVQQRTSPHCCRVASLRSNVMSRGTPSGELMTVQQHHR
jgi:hypothetical protein